MDRNEYLTLSCIEKAAFCARQAYLHYREQEDAENRYIIDGQHLHQRVTEAPDETRGDVRITRSLHLVNHDLGIYGIADVVEFAGDVPLPVEYKRGRGGKRQSQHIQLGLQVLCLEEMLGKPIQEAAIYHGGSKRREAVAIDAGLRTRCRDAVTEARRLLQFDRAPVARPFSGCRACSLVEICLPMAGNRSVGQYLNHRG